MTSELIQVPMTELRVGFGRRLGAYMLDTLVLVVLSLVANAFFGQAFESVGETYFQKQMAEQNVSLEELDTEQADVVMGTMSFMSTWLIMISIVGLAYFGLTEVLLAASFGKMMLGIMIANADGTSASTSTLVIRWLAKTGLAYLLLIFTFFSSATIFQTLYYIVAVVAFIGYFLMFGANRQALHDIIAKTAVYRREHIRQAEEAPAIG